MPARSRTQAEVTDARPPGRPDAATAELESLRASLEHAQRLATLGTLTGLIAHEFNNILTPVMSYAQLALEKPADAALARKALERAADGSERAARIAAAILSFARQEPVRSTGNIGAANGHAADAGAETVRSPSGSIPFGGVVEHEVTRVADAIERALACLARDPKKDGIELTVNVPEELAVRMRPIALQQVLLNLVLNARKAMAAGGGRLSISARAESHRPMPEGVGGAQGAAEKAGGDGSGWLRIEVADSGCGMSPELLARVFDPFVSGEPGGVSGGGGAQGVGPSGSGLGLALCRRLVDQVGGTLWATSSPGRGSVFVLGLPVA